MLSFRAMYLNSTIRIEWSFLSTYKKIRKTSFMSNANSYKKVSIRYISKSYTNSVSYARIILEIKKSLTFNANYGTIYMVMIAYVKGRSMT